MNRTWWIVVPMTLLAACLCGAPINAAERTVTLEVLQQQLKERDAAIIELQHTVRALLQRLDNIERSLEPVQQAPLTPQVPEIAAPETPPSQETGQSGGSSQVARLAVDEEDAERALERTLVEEGALLLPAGTMEVQPTFTYTFNEFDFPSQLVNPSGQVGSTTVKRDIFEADLAVRLGLPFDSQLELGLPYRWINQDSRLSVAGAPASEVSRSGNGVGDFSVGVAKTLVREGEWWPDVVLRGTWDTGTGSVTDNDVVLGGGFDSLTGSISLLKRRDPLAFFGSAGYQTSFESDDFKPGNQVFFQIGTALAVSPDSSLIASVDNQFFSEAEFNGRDLDGSDLTAVTLNLGASTIVAKGVLLRFNSGIGITEDAPDYSIGISGSVRFDAFSHYFAGL